MVKTVAISCPNCGSADISARGNDDYQCNHCHTYFVATNAGPPPASPYGARAGPKPKAGQTKKLIVISAVVSFVAMMMGIGVVFLVSTDSPPPKAPPPKSAFVEAAPTGAPPQANIERRADGTTSIGGRFWLVDYANTGEVEIINPAFSVSLFDPGGSRVAEQTGYAVRKRLKPGLSTTILVLISKPPEYADSKLDLIPPTSSGFASNQFDLQITEFSEQPTVGSLRKIVGTVYNPSDVDVGYVTVVVVGRDEDELPVSFARGGATLRSLEAKQQSGFSVNVGTFEIEPPKKWEIFAVATPK